MRIFSLFQLLVVLYALYGILYYRGIIRGLIPALCLIVILIFERIVARIKEDEAARERFLRYKAEEERELAMQEKKKIQPSSTPELISPEDIEVITPEE